MSVNPQNSDELLISQTCFIANKAQIIPDTTAANAAKLQKDVDDKRKKNFKWEVAYSTLKYNILLNLDDPQFGKISNFPDLNEIGNKWMIEIIFYIKNFDNNIYGILGNMYNNIVPNNSGWGIFLKNKNLSWEQNSSSYQLTDLGEIIIDKNYSLKISKNNTRYDFTLFNIDDNIKKNTFINDSSQLITNKGFVVLGGIWDCNYFGKETYLATLNGTNVTFTNKNSVCSNYGSKVATYSQLNNAQQSDGTWCSPGWISDDMFPYYPLSQSELGKGNCGFSPGTIKAPRYNVSSIGSNFIKASLPNYNWNELSISSDGTIQVGTFMSGSESFIAISTDAGKTWMVTVDLPPDKIYSKEKIGTAVKNGDFNKIPVDDFKLSYDLPYWKLTITFDSNDYRNTWQGIIGNMYNTSVPGRGWGLWISPEGFIHWSNSVNGENLTSLGTLTNGSPYKLVVTLENNIYKFELTNTNNNTTTSQSLNRTGPLITDTGFVTIGGAWEKVQTEKFKGNITNVTLITEPNVFPAISARRITNSNLTWSCIAVNSSGYSLFAGTDGGLVYVSYNLGKSWFGISRNGNGRWRGIAISDDSNYVALCQNGGPIRISKDAGQTFSDAYPSVLGSDIAMSSNGKFITVVCAPSPGINTLPQQSPASVSNDYTIIVSNNFGETGSWSRVQPAKYFYSVAMSENGQIQVTGAYGGDIYISTNYGVSWTVKTGLPGNKLWTSFSINGIGDIMTTCTKTGFFYISTDYGRSWNQKNVANTQATNWQSNKISKDGGVIILASDLDYYSSIYNVLDPLLPVNCYGYKNNKPAVDNGFVKPFNSQNWYNPQSSSYVKDQVINIFYTGQPISFPCKNAKKISIECWGANGGSCSNIPSSFGGYSYGQFSINDLSMLYVFVGQKGTDATIKKESVNGGLNGGGDGTYDGSVSQNNFSGAGGGGATDVRTTLGTWNSNLDSRIIVAGGGGGSSIYNTGGNGGGLSGKDGETNNQPDKCGYGSGGTIASGGESFGSLKQGKPGTKGIGGIGASPGKYFGSGGGGGGWYGGGGGGVKLQHTGDTATGGGAGAGGGGSSYIGGVENGKTYTKGDDLYVTPPILANGNGYCKIVILETIPVIIRQQLNGDVNSLRVYQPNDTANIDMDEDKANKIFSRGKIFKRECFDCNYTYSTIYYERITPIPSGFSIFSMFKDSWNPINNIHNVDFKLYSSYNDLLYQRNPWSSCKFATDIGFPGECVPNSLYKGPGQWNSTVLNGVKEVKYSLLNIIEDVPTSIDGLIGWFDGNSWDNVNNVWLDKSNKSNNIQNSNDIAQTVNYGNGSEDCSYIYGDSNSSLLLKQTAWPGVDKPYTFFHVTRYTGNTRGRIWNGNSSDWTSGFMKNSVSYYHGGFLNSSDGNPSKDNKYFGNDWVLSTDQNKYVRVYKDLNEYNGSPGTSPSSISINTGFINEPSDWACAEIIIYNKKLSLDDILLVEDYLINKYNLNIEIKKVTDVREREKIIKAEEEARLKEEARIKYLSYVAQEEKIALDKKKYEEYVKQEAIIAENIKKYKVYIEQEAILEQDRKKYNLYIEQEQKIAENKKKYQEYIKQEQQIADQKKYKTYVEQENKLTEILKSKIQNTINTVPVSPVPKTTTPLQPLPTVTIPVGPTIPKETPTQPTPASSGNWFSNNIVIVVTVVVILIIIIVVIIMFSGGGGAEVTSNIGISEIESPLKEIETPKE